MGDIKEFDLILVRREREGREWIWVRKRTWTQMRESLWSREEEQD